MTALIVKGMIFIKKALNPMFYRAAGGENRPVFFNIEKTFPALLEIEKHFDVIKKELNGVLIDSQSIPLYHEIDQNQQDISGSDEKNWRIFMLYAMGEKPDNNRDRCPRTSALLDEIPNLFQAVFSVLEPGKSVPAHKGPYLGYLRYHLGLKVPTNKPPSIRVKDQIYTWKEGESILFDDSWEHEVYNDCPDTRVIMMVDVLRPLPGPLHLLNYLYTYWVVRNVYGKRSLKKLNALRQDTDPTRPAP
jgi:aspartyl/asparaginyl beta-hydroxylase (cupin superfamily)